MTRVALTLPVFALLAFAGTASAATSVLDSGSSRSCFAAARVGTATPAALAACDSALENTTLTLNEQAAAYANRAVLHLDAKDGAAALADADAALSLAPALHDAAIDKAGALILLGRFADARATLDEALPKLSGIALERGLYNRAMAHEALGDVTAAYHDYKRAADLNPKFDAANLELARFQVK